MEVYFVDIGRGTSNLILLGGRRAIVIDCGQNSGSLLQLLAQFRVDTIARLIISHNHHDHVGGAMALLTQYEGRVDRICFVHDDVLLKSKFGGKILQQIKNGTLKSSQLLRLECDHSPRYIFQESNDLPTLQIVSPTFTDNLQAITEGNPNATSGVLV
ncbi:MBL fold metallo-hydrolase, partial [Singulisphaera acidiphila]